MFSSYQGLSEENVRLMRVNIELERESYRLLVPAHET